jgi:hypothetical protein
MSRIANGWELAKQSCAVLANDKKLLVFPIISTIACALVMASFVVPLLLTIDWKTVTTSNSQQINVQFNKPAYYALVFAFYFVNYFVIVFFNSALVACVHEQFRGGTPTVGQGLSVAASRLPQIALWALVSATVGMVLQMIAERSKLVGQIVSSLLGAAWSLATYFAVPVLVVERAGPFDVFKRSVSLLKQTWGEGLVANLSLGFIIFLATLVGAIPLLVGIGLAAANNSAVPALAGLAISFAAWIILALISSTLKVILTTAIYEYASSGTAPGAFDGQLLQEAFRRK